MAFDNNMSSDSTTKITVQYTKAVQKCSISDRIHEHDIASANFKVKKKITWIHLINTISKLIHQLNISKINPGLYIKLLALISRYLSRLYSLPGKEQ